MLDLGFAEEDARTRATMLLYAGIGYLHAAEQSGPRTPTHSTGSSPCRRHAERAYPRAWVSRQPPPSPHHARDLHGRERRPHHGHAQSRGVGDLVDGGHAPPGIASWTRR